MRDHQDIFDEMQEEARKEAGKPEKPMPKEEPAEKVLPTFPPRKAKTVVKTAKKGGYVRAADGCAQRGKTRGRMV